MDRQATPPSFATTAARSLAVLARPSVSTFTARLEGANFLHAARYVALAAVLAALVALPQGNAAVLGTFLSALLGFAGFAWFLQRLSMTGTNDLSAGAVAYAIALFWAPLSVVASLFATLLSWTGVGLALLPFVGLAMLVLGLALAYLATGALLPERPAVGRIVLVLLAGVAAAGIDRFVWMLVG